MAIGVVLGLLYMFPTLGGILYEMFLVSAPVNAPGGIGSPANAVAIK